MKASLYSQVSRRVVGYGVVLGLLGSTAFGQISDERSSEEPRGRSTDIWSDDRWEFANQAEQSFFDATLDDDPTLRSGGDDWRRMGSSRRSLMESLRRAPSPRFSALIDREEVQDCFYCLYDQAGAGTRDFESAAWITRDGGVYRCIQTGWTQSGSGMAKWVGGPRPRGYQAIAHTHPTRSKRNVSTHLPSENDREMARNLKPNPAPVYTVTRRGIWKYDPRIGPEGSLTQVAGTGWYRDAEKRCKNRCSQILE